MGLNGSSDEFRDVLVTELDRRKKVNPSYSIRSFAKHLEVDHSSLAKILKGQIPLGRKIIQRLAPQLGYSDQEIYSLTNPSTLKRPKNFKSISKSQFTVISGWHHYAILCLTETIDFKKSAKWIASRLGLDTSTVRDALNRLKKLDLIKVTPNGQWLDNTGGFTTTLSEAETSRAARIHQQQVLKMAVDAIDSIPLEKRKQTSATITMHPKDLKKAQRKIDDFRDEMIALFGSRGNPEEVYHLNLSFYPVTKTPNKGK